MSSDVAPAYLPLFECTSDGNISYGIVQPGPHYEQGVPIIRVNNVNNGNLDISSPIKVHPDIEEKHRRTRLVGGEILLTLVGSTGQAVIAGPELAGWNVARAIAVIRPSSEISATWIKICLQSDEVQHFLDTRANTTVQKTINLKDVRNIPILNLPKEDRRFIEGCWNSINDKIELNRRMNATLEGMAQALFKSWFVDFDPVIDNALATGNPIPEELAERAEVRRKALADGTANREAAKQFPAAFQLTEEMGWIPEGWEAVTINKAIQINPSVKLSKGTIAKFADMKALPTDGYAIDSVIDKAYSGGAKFQNDDVLLARITPCLENGKTGIVDFLSNPTDVGFGSTEFIVLRGKGELRLPYVACLARGNSFRLHCIQSMVGSSGRQRVQNACFDNFYIARPTDFTVLKNFSSISMPMFQKVSEQAKESRTLTNLRDTLLPKLISGELRIPGAEQLAEDAMI